MNDKRQPINLNLFHHWVPLQTRFNDVDSLGHINNSIHQQYYDIGRLNYFVDVVDEKVQWEGEVVVVAHLEIDFLHPMGLYDKARVGSRIRAFGNRSFQMEQVICDENNTIFSHSTSILVGFNAQHASPTDIPHHWRDAMERFEALSQ